MNKRKILLLALSLCMVAILAVGGTLAYFTDTDNATNVFTVGYVDIELKENFTQEDGGTKLHPGKQNAVQKEVYITLDEDSEDSYVWYEYLIPSVLDSTDGSTGTNNIVHVNAYGYTWDKYYQTWTGPNGETVTGVDYTWDHDANVELSSLVGPEGYIGKRTVDGVEYNVYVVLYHGKLSNDGGQTQTTPAMSQVYLDQGVDYVHPTENADGYYIDKNGNKIDYDLSGEIKIIVYAYAIQADGFADVYEAYTAYQAQPTAEKNQ